MIHSQLSPPNMLPHPQLLLRFPHPNPDPLPPKQENNSMIQIQLQPQPQPLLFVGQTLLHPQESLQPQLVAVKSLIFIASKGFIYGLFYALPHVYVSKDKNDFLKHLH